MRHFPPTFAVLTLALICSVGRAEIHWENSLKVAHAQAQLEGKLLLLHFYSDYCVWCDRLEAGAYQQPQVAEAIHRHYVPVKIHAGQNPTIAKAFRVNAYPTDVIVTTEATVLVHRTSPQAPDEYVAMLTQHAQNAATAQPTTAIAGDPAAPETATQSAAEPQMTAAAADGMVEADDHGPAGDVAGGTPVLPASHRNAAVKPEPRPAPPPKLALDGYCAVSISDKSEWIEGNPELGVIHLGNLYLFVDEAAMAKFLADPEPYTPVLNGIDVVRFFEEKRIVPGKRDFGVKDPDHNRMFFFSDEAAMVHFENQHARYTDAAIAITRQAVADANPRR